jgi:hypothetical protein
VSRNKGEPSAVVETVVSVAVALVVTLVLHYLSGLSWSWSIIGGLIAGLGGWLTWLAYCHLTSKHDYGRGDRSSLTAIVDELF